jgi:Domain of unknown function (DUF4390)
LEFSHSVVGAPRRSPPFSALCGWVLLCFLATTAAHAETTLIIRDGELRLGENVYELDTTLVIELDDAARNAIDGGLTMRLDYEIGISRIRNYLPDDGIASLVQSYELNYHALSQRYLLRNLNTSEQFDFGSLEAALGRLSSIRSLPVIDANLLPPGAAYNIRVRAVLDMGGTPAALKWLLFWTEDWGAASRWYSWTLRL